MLDKKLLSTLSAAGFGDRLLFDSALARRTWFQVGGNADIFFMPQDIQDLQKFLHLIPHDMFVLPIGMASNLLVRDGGVRGAVIKLGQGFQHLSYDNGLIMAGAGVRDVNLAQFALQKNVMGFEFYTGIPGSVGGAVMMNAGCFGGETCDILHHADIITRQGEYLTLQNSDLKFAYRHAELPPQAICVAAYFNAKAGDAKTIRHKMAKLKEDKNNHQPMAVRTGGSTFKNPLPKHAWQLIDAVGLRGYRVGGAMFSEKHCNFLLNDNHASAADIEKLAELAIKLVYEKFHIHLEWEIKKVGEAMI
ncbi:MAG: UDP-N-acetylmuramate dehydrogenase [Alphaproteobacteria bacterium]